ncbi:MAG: TRAM domain-containing protein [Candidatus Woesearchaeota archaeon]
MYGNFGGRDFRPRGGIAPIKVGEELDVTIEAVGEKGDGIAKKNGFVIFVPNTKQGQKVRIRVTKVLAKVGFAEVVEAAKEAPAPAAEPAVEEVAEEAPSSPEDTETFGEEETEE